jgi:hypothetical protein
MWAKPFKPPTLLRTAQKPVVRHEPIDLTESPRPTKKQRLVHVIEESPTKPLPVISATIVAPRKPLLPVINPISATKATEALVEGPDGYYLVLW